MADFNIVKKTLEGRGFETCHFFDTAGTQAFGAANAQTILLSFRGMGEVQDFVADAPS